MFSCLFSSNGHTYCLLIESSKRIQEQTNKIDLPCPFLLHVVLDSHCKHLQQSYESDTTKMLYLDYITAITCIRSE